MSRGPWIDELPEPVRTRWRQRPIGGNPSSGCVHVEGAKPGTELFIIDAGWYADRGTNWWSTTGDWTPGDRLPRGSKPIRAYARKKGLLFGRGRRTDIGMVRRFHHTWVTDWQIAPRSMRIINGMTLALPPEYVDRNIGVCQEGHTRADLDFQCRAVLFGRMTVSGIHPAGVRPNPEHVKRIQHYVHLYKEFIRPMHRTSRLFHDTPELPGREPRGWGVLELASADAARAVVGLFRLAGPAEPTYRVRLRGLDVGRRYRVTFDNTNQSMRATGAELMHDGLTVRLQRALSSELLRVES